MGWELGKKGNPNNKKKGIQMKKYYFSCSEYGSLRLLDEDWEVLWIGDEEDIGIEFLEDSEEWEFGYRDKVNKFFFDKFGITEDQIEEW